MQNRVKETVHRVLSRIRLPSSKNRECCIFKPDGLGDFVLAAGAIQQLNRQWGDEKCTLVTSHLNHACAEYLFPRNPKINTGYSFGGWRRGEPLSSLFGVMPNLSQVRFKTLVCLRHQRASSHQAMLLEWIHADRQYGMRPLETSKWDRFGDATLFYPGVEKAADGVCLELEAHAAVLSQCIGVPFTGKELRPRLSAQPGEGYLLFNPYASTEKKEYPIARWAEVVDLTEKEYPGVECRVICPPNRRGEASVTFKGRVVRTASFQDYYESISRADAVVTIDTGTAHLSVAMDKPTVVLIGGAHFGMFGPWRTSERQVWINHDLPCYQCGWHCTQPEITCLTAIKPEQVVSSLKALLLEVQQGRLIA
jgi:ADP-heptose:LPS heptosyltransferase